VPALAIVQYTSVTDSVTQIYFYYFFFNRRLLGRAQFHSSSPPPMPAKAALSTKSPMALILGKSSLDLDSDEESQEEEGCSTTKVYW
jgi:hypothetical protein